MKNELEKNFAHEIRQLALPPTGPRLRLKSPNCRFTYSRDQDFEIAKKYRVLITENSGDRDLFFRNIPKYQRLALKRRIFRDFQSQGFHSRNSGFF